MLFMYLEVLAEFSTDVLVIIDLDPGHEFSWTDISGDTIYRWGYIQLEIARAHHLNPNIPGSFLKARVFWMHRQLSFSVRMRRSTTGTCSSREHLLSIISNGASSPCRGSNCPLNSMKSRVNLHFMYILRTSLIADIIVVIFAFLKNATISDLIAQFIVTRKGIFLTFITPTCNTTFPIVVHNCCWDWYHPPRAHLVRCFSRCFPL